MTTTATIYTGLGKSEVKQLPPPKLGMTTVKAVGPNPTDWKYIDFGMADAGARIGCDYAGVVEEVGGKVNKDFGWECAGSLGSDGGKYASSIPVSRDSLVAVNPNEQRRVWL
ncbi:hypothetical protein BJX64DRAFT_286085 [Aspergillus heterothallicus]